MGSGLIVRKLSPSLLAWLLLQGLFGACSRPTQWRLEYDESLANALKRYQGQACADSRACGPFVCDSASNRCTSRACRVHYDCYPNACIQGLCVQAPLQGGSSCEPIDIDELYKLREEAREDVYADLDGCACSPQGILDKGWGDGSPCGSFPCAPGGCYVSKCSGDSDCRYGWCSKHASGPADHCVTSDPY